MIALILIVLFTAFVVYSYIAPIINKPFVPPFPIGRSNIKPFHVPYQFEQSLSDYFKTRHTDSTAIIKMLMDYTDKTQETKEEEIV
jgi:hypothetical protein